MDISYSLLMEDYARINPLLGLEELSEKIVPAGAAMQVVPKKADIAAQNAASVAALKGMMSGVRKRK